MEAKHTEGPWFVRTHERMGEIRDCFVAAKDVQGLPYDAEILGDDEYREDDGIQRKLADARRIVQCVNAHDELVEALRLIANTDTANDATPGTLEDARRIARSALAKALASPSP